LLHNRGVAKKSELSESILAELAHDHNTPLHENSRTWRSSPVRSYFIKKCKSGKGKSGLSVYNGQGSHLKHGSFAKDQTTGIYKRLIGIVSGGIHFWSLKCRITGTEDFAQ